MRVIILILSSFLLTSCMTHKKFIDYADSNDELLAMLCAAKYPITTEFIEGEKVRDTTYVEVPFFIDCDSVVNANNKVKEANVPLGKESPNKPPKNLVTGKVKVPVVNTTQTNTLNQNNNAQFTLLNNQIIKLKSDIVEKDKKISELEDDNKALKRFRVISLGLGALFLILMYLYSKRK